MISEKEELLEWRKRAAAQPAGRVVLDLEADSLHRYQEKNLPDPICGRNGFLPD